MADSTSTLPTRVVIREVGLRDGLQSIARVLPTSSKLEWLHDAYVAGQREMELGSFVPPDRLPQLADTAEMLRFARILPGLRTSVLVPNLRGAEGALDGEADLMLIPLSASHAHSLANQRRTPDEMVAEIGRIRALRDARGSRTRIEVCISMAFGCSIQGAVAPAEVLRLLAAALDAGADVAGLADSHLHARVLAPGLEIERRQVPAHGLPVLDHRGDPHHDREEGDGQVARPVQRERVGGDALAACARRFPVVADDLVHDLQSQQADAQPGGLAPASASPPPCFRRRPPCRPACRARAAAMPP